MVAEVEVDQDTGKITVKRMVVANDAGRFRIPTDCATRSKAARCRA